MNNITRRIDGKFNLWSKMPDPCAPAEAIGKSFRAHRWVITKVCDSFNEALAYSKGNK